MTRETLDPVLALCACKALEPVLAFCAYTPGLMTRETPGSKTLDPLLAFSPCETRYRVS